MSNIETRKEVASTAYALDHFDEDANIMALQQAWLAGFETAYPKWNKGIPEHNNEVIVKLQRHHHGTKSKTEIKQFAFYEENRWQDMERDNIEDNDWTVIEFIEIPQ